MTIRLYFDEDSMWQALITALRTRGIDVQTALEATMVERADADHLAYATAQGRVLCSFNVGTSIAFIRAIWPSTKCMRALSSRGSSNTV